MFDPLLLEPVEAEDVAVPVPDFDAVPVPDFDAVPEAEPVELLVALALPPLADVDAGATAARFWTVLHFAAEFVEALSGL